MNLLLFGATGLVGQQVLNLVLSDPRVNTVTAPGRRAPPQHAKLQSPLIDFDDPPADAPWWQADAVICTLGTTMRAAGSKAAFRRVDHDYPLAVARLARRAGTPAFVLNSAIGADVASRVFYNQVKGELERDLATVGFPSLTFVRPGLIDGQREEVRAAEHVAAQLLKLFRPLVPRHWRTNPATRIAYKMTEAAIASRPGTHVVSAEEMA